MLSMASRSVLAPQCTHRFRRKHDLERHLVAHAGLKPYVCVACSKGFTRMDALNKHYRAEPLCKQEMELQRGQGVLRTTAMARQVKTHLGRLHGLVNGEPVNGRCARGTLTAAAVANNNTANTAVGSALSSASSYSTASPAVREFSMPPAFASTLRPQDTVDHWSRSNPVTGSDASSSVSTSSRSSTTSSGVRVANYQRHEPDSLPGIPRLSPYPGVEASHGSGASYQQYSPASSQHSSSVSPSMGVEDGSVSPISLPPISTFDFPPSTPSGNSNDNFNYTTPTHERNGSRTSNSNSLSLDSHATTTTASSYSTSAKAMESSMHTTMERNKACSPPMLPMMNELINPIAEPSSASSASSISSSPPLSLEDAAAAAATASSRYTSYYYSPPQRESHGLPPLHTAWQNDGYNHRATTTTISTRSHTRQPGSPISPLRSPADPSSYNTSPLLYATSVNNKSTYTSPSDSFRQSIDDGLPHDTMPCTPSVSPRSLRPSHTASPGTRIFHSGTDTTFDHHHHHHHHQQHYDMSRKLDHFQLPVSVASPPYHHGKHTDPWMPHQVALHQLLHQLQQQYHVISIILYHHHPHHGRTSSRHYNDTLGSHMDIDEPTEGLPMSPVDAAHVMLDWTRHQRHL
ncbi:hypothetical protein BDF22DRAFT_746651 [Syncephalis plumigaleata]|nr:hypothetical protein BDF22DRAFT_746651 [Syncephalis plumigaleata]